MTEPPWRIGSPSLSRRKTSHGSRVRPSPAETASTSRSGVFWSVISGGCRRRSSRGAQNRVADPLRCLTVVSAERKALLGFRAVVRDDRPELIPIGLAVGPDARRVIKDEIGIRNPQPELPDPRPVDRQELLAKLLGGLGLEPPVDVTIL